MGDSLGERLAVDELHDEEVPIAGFLQPVQRGDAGMIERREQLGFALEPCDGVRFLGERLRKQLDGDALTVSGTVVW